MEPARPSASASSCTPPDNGADTRLRILDAAETLFVANGYAATSLRAIVPIYTTTFSATHYHFGSKEGLLSAVLKRQIQPINDDRLRKINELGRSERTLTIRSILQAFFTPVVEGIPDTRAPALMARMFYEPDALIRPLLEETFGEVISRFQAALSDALPGIPFDEVRWRFHFTVGSMVHLL
ncbi:MAG: TetR/AcrR family transcriptional regulator, partial [Proteobacteria bacterium]|nr:TetR/AcrR family transcriptional regulator [Pseudomonadota bacterium]